MTIVGTEMFPEKQTARAGTVLLSQTRGQGQIKPIMQWDDYGLIKIYGPQAWTDRYKGKLCLISGMSASPLEG